MANRVLIGPYAGDYQLRVSKPGYDVTTALDVENMAFDSQWSDLAQIVTRGSATVSGSWTTSGVFRYRFLASFTSMGFVPHVLLWKHGVSSQYLTNALSANTIMARISHNSIWVGYNYVAVLNGDAPSPESAISSATWDYAITKVPAY